MRETSNSNRVDFPLIGFSDLAVLVLVLIEAFDAKLIRDNIPEAQFQKCLLGKGVGKKLIVSEAVLAMSGNAL